MGFDLASVDAMTGPIYMGANSSWEVIWLIVSILICVLSLVTGSRHELDAYKKLKK